MSRNHRSNGQAGFLSNNLLLYFLFSCFALAACGGGYDGPVHFIISGQVTLNGEGYEGATVTLGADGSGIDTTDASGNYSFSGLPNGTYTVTAWVSGQTVTPATITGIVIDRDDSPGHDFALVTYTISGGVTRGGGEGYPGVLVTLSGDADGSTTTDASGNYSFPGLLNGDYTVTPSAAGETFSPESRPIIIYYDDQTVPDFVAVLPGTYSISGRVTLNGAGYGGATVTLGGDGGGIDTTTDASGNYSFANLLPGTYTVTPSSTEGTFIPSDWTGEITADDVIVPDFTFSPFSPGTYSISGRVTYGLDEMEGVEVVLTGAAESSTRTDGSGQYAFSGLTDGTYAVTPVCGPQVFSPITSEVVVSGEDEENVHFTVSSMIWLVDGSAPVDVQNGYTWGTAFRHPQNGTDMASSGEQVWVGRGIYGPLGESDQVLYLAPGVGYFGGFAGSETSLTQRDISSNPTILDGENLVGVVEGASGARLDGFFVSGGYAGNGAGMLNDDVSGLRVANCRFTGNRAGDQGGGMHFDNCIGVEISNCVFTGNTAGQGGGMSFIGSIGTIVNSTITQNQAVGVNDPGGGIFRNPGGSLNIINAIVWGNFPDQFSSNAITVSFSDIQGDEIYPGTGNINREPRFEDDGDADYHLDEDSPCIDAGSNDAVISTWDLDGNDRVLDGDEDGTAVVDMGAYEYVMVD